MESLPVTQTDILPLCHTTNLDPLSLLEITPGQQKYCCGSPQTFLLQSFWDRVLHGDANSGNPAECVGILWGWKNGAGTPPLYVTRHPGQLSLLPSAGWEMNTVQRAVMLFGSGVDRRGSFHLCINIWMAGKLCNLSLTCA